MAKVKLSPIFAEFSGTCGGLVFKKSRRGEAILAERPRKSSTAPSEAQKAQRERFKQAVAYARAALADPAVRIVYEKMALKQGMSAFAAAQSDYFKGTDLLSGK